MLLLIPPLISGRNSLRFVAVRMLPGRSSELSNSDAQRPVVASPVLEGTVIKVLYVDLCSGALQAGQTDMANLSPGLVAR